MCKVSIFMTCDYHYGVAGAGVLLLAEMDGHAPVSKYFYETDMYSSLAALKALTKALKMITKKCEVSIISDNTYIITLLKHRGLYIENNYRKKDGKPLANVTMVKDLYKIEEKKEKLFGQPFVYYTGTNNNIIFALKKRLFKDLIG